MISWTASARSGPLWTTSSEKAICKKLFSYPRSPDTPQEKCTRRIPPLVHFSISSDKRQVCYDDPEKQQNHRRTPDGNRFVLLRGHEPLLAAGGGRGKHRKGVFQKPFLPYHLLGLSNQGSDACPSHKRLRAVDGAACRGRDAGRGVQFLRHRPYPVFQRQHARPSPPSSFPPSCTGNGSSCPRSPVCCWPSAGRSLF